jgi:hypothetical protein
MTFDAIVTGVMAALCGIATVWCFGRAKSYPPLKGPNGNSDSEICFRPDASRWRVLGLHMASIGGFSVLSFILDPFYLVAIKGLT